VIVIKGLYAKKKVNFNDINNIKPFPKKNRIIDSYVKTRKYSDLVVKDNKKIDSYVNWRKNQSGLRASKSIQDMVPIKYDEGY
jgi:hypothetical protein